MSPFTDSKEFIAWMVALKRIAIEKYDYVEQDFDPEEWWQYYADQYTPEAALLEDASYCYGA